MKCGRAVAFAAAVILLAGSAAGSEVWLYPDEAAWNGSGGIKVSPGCTFTALVRVHNTSGWSIDGFFNGFEIYTRDAGGLLTDNYAYVLLDTLPINWSQYGINSISFPRRSVDGFGKDTVGIGGFTLFAGGLPDGFDEFAWYISVTTHPDSRWQYLCIDSVFIPPGGHWLWSAGSEVVLPQFPGPYCFELLAFPCGETEFLDGVTSLEFPVNRLVEYEFVASNYVNPEIPSYRLLEGPGTVTTIDDTVCLWQYTPSAADVGMTYSVKIQGKRCENCDWKEFDVTFCEPEFAFPEGCGTVREIPQGETLTLDMAIPCLGYPPFLISFGGAPEGVCSIDGDVLTFAGTAECRGAYSVTMGMADGADTITCTVPIVVTDTTCYRRGNVDGRMDPEPEVNIADLSYLVSYVFKSGLRPACWEEGDTNGDDVVNVGDIVYLVGYIFSGAAAPPPCD